MSKNELYEEMSKVLTEYETDDNKDVYANLQDMYKVLSTVKNNWEVLTK